MSIDQSVLAFLVNHRLPWLNSVASFITYAGSLEIVALLTLILVIYHYRRGSIPKAFSLLASVGGSTATAYVIKFSVNRSRPPLADMLLIDSGPSFPSGHATAAMALYGFLIYLIWKSRSHYSKTWAALLGLLIILVGWSRLYLGVHYISDVLVGYIVGLIWIALSVKLKDKIERILNWMPKIRR